MFPTELLVNSLAAGILLGGFYALIAIGLSISFGLIDVVNIAHPTFIILAGYIVYMLNLITGIDPVILGVSLSPIFYVLGVVVYGAYNRAFEKRGQEALMGLVFFFGILILIEVSLLLRFGVDLRTIYAPYTMESISLGILTMPLRLVYPFIAGLIIVLVLYLFFSKTFIGIATRAVSQDDLAVKLMGAKPAVIKSVAFGLSIATASIAGGLLIAMQPIHPFLDREFIGRVFAIVVLGGMGSILGTIAAGIILGVVESLTASLYGPAWALAVSFGILIAVLVLKPEGLFRR